MYKGAYIPIPIGYLSCFSNSTVLFSRYLRLHIFVLYAATLK